MKMPTYAYAPGEWKVWGNEWRRSLVADNKSPNTVRNYLHALRLLGEWVIEKDGECSPVDVSTSAIRDYIGGLIGRTSPGNAHNNYRSLRTFYNWLVKEDEIDRSPMDRTNAPQLEEKPIPIVTFEMMESLLDVCSGKTFEDRRDNAIIRTYFDTGSRKTEALLKLDDLGEFRRS